MKMKDARKLVTRLTLAELKYFATIGLVFDVNTYDPDDAERTEQMLRKRPPMLRSKLTRHGLKPVGFSER